MAKQPKAVGQIVGFKEIESGWTLLHLDDGNYLRVKTVVTKVKRQSIIMPDGNPAYWFQTSQAAAVLTAEEVQTLYKEKLKP